MHVPLACRVASKLLGIRRMHADSNPRSVKDGIYALSGKPKFVCVPPCLSEVSLKLPLKQFQYWPNWQWSILVLWRKVVKHFFSMPLCSGQSMVWYCWLSFPTGSVPSFIWPTGISAVSFVLTPTCPGQYICRILQRLGAKYLNMLWTRLNNKTWFAVGMHSYIKITMVLEQTCRNYLCRLFTDSNILWRHTWRSWCSSASTNNIFQVGTCIFFSFFHLIIYIGQ